MVLMEMSFPKPTLLALEAKLTVVLVGDAHGDVLGKPQEPRNTSIYEKAGLTTTVKNMNTSRQKHRPQTANMFRCTRPCQPESERP